MSLKSYTATGEQCFERCCDPTCPECNDVPMPGNWAYPAVSCQPDPINQPTHYTYGGIETIDVIEAWSLGFHLGNAVKYISRAKHKGKELEDLKKARWYLDREISRLEGK